MKNKLLEAARQIVYFDGPTEATALAMMELRQAALDHKGRP